MVTSELTEKRSAELTGATISEPVTAVVTEPSLSRKAIEMAQQIRHSMSSATRFKLKVVLSVLMFGSLFLFGKVDLNKTWETACNANPTLLAVTALLFLFSFVPTARRWQILARALGLCKPLTELLKLCFVGVFFNLFLPSTVGGDVSRCYYLSKGTGLYKEGFYSVLADRACGIAVLFLTATLGILLSPDAQALPMELKVPIFLGTAGTFLVLPVMPWLTRKLLGEKNWVTRQFNSSAAQVFWSSKTLIPVSLAWSFISQLVLVACHIGIGLSLGLTEIPVWYYFVFYPSVAVLGFITPSFNGIGIREWAYTYFLMLVGVDKAHALTYALMWLGLTTFGSVFGGLVYMATHMKPPPKELDQVG